MRRANLAIYRHRRIRDVLSITVSLLCQERLAVRGLGVAYEVRRSGRSERHASRPSFLHVRSDMSFSRRWQERLATALAAHSCRRPSKTRGHSCPRGQGLLAQRRGGRGGPSLDPPSMTVEEQGRRHADLSTMLGAVRLRSASTVDRRPSTVDTRRPRLVVTGPPCWSAGGRSPRPSLRSSKFFDPREAAKERKGRWSWSPGGR